jgi:hypothetical protein
MGPSHIPPLDLQLQPGISWAGTFVKHGTYKGRGLRFQLSIQLVINSLAPVPGAVGPMQTVTAHERAVDAACRNALLRLKHTDSTIDLRREDFRIDPGATESALAA